MCRKEWRTCLGRVKLLSNQSIPFRVFSVFPTTWGDRRKLKSPAVLPQEEMLPNRSCRFPWPGIQRFAFGFRERESSSRGKVGSLLLALHFSSGHRSCWSVGIATRFPGAVGRVENLLLVFHAFHGRHFNSSSPDFSMGERLPSLPCQISKQRACNLSSPAHLRGFRACVSSHHHGRRLGPAGGDVGRDEAWGVLASVRHEF